MASDFASMLRIMREAALYVQLGANVWMYYLAD